MLQGSFVALITPFSSSGEIDFDRLDFLIEWHLKNKTDGLVVAGITAEPWALTEEEEEQLLTFVLQKVQGKIPVVMGTGKAGTRVTREKTEKAKTLGADAALVIIPYCNRPSFAGCLAHYKEVAKAGLPLMLYHHPKRTGVTLSCEQIAAIIEHVPQIIAVKESSGDLQIFACLAQSLSVPLFCGDDPLFEKASLLGAKGNISVLANAFPLEWNSFIQSALLGDRERAVALNTLFQPLYETLFLETNPQGIKHLMHFLGLIDPYLRLPMVSVGAEVAKKIEESCALLLSKTSS